MNKPDESAELAAELASLRATEGPVTQPHQPAGPQLLPCPFCGSKPVISRMTATSSCFKIRCNICWVRSGDHSEEAACVTAWNTRANLTHADILPDPALVAADIVENSTDKEHMQARIEAELTRAASHADAIKELRAENERLVKWQDLAFELLSEIRQWVAPGSITDLEAPKALRALMRDRTQRCVELTELRAELESLRSNSDTIKVIEAKRDEWKVKFDSYVEREKYGAANEFAVQIATTEELIALLKES